MLGWWTVVLSNNCHLGLGLELGLVLGVGLELGLELVSFTQISNIEPHIHTS